MSRRRPLPLLLLGAALLGTGSVRPPGLSAQETELDQVDALLATGRFSSAREALQGWFDGAEGGASREERQRGLWLRAVLTVDPEMAAVDLRRLVVRYPGGPYSDRALFRLAQGARALSEEIRALEYVEDLLRDYPESALRDRAEALAGEIRAGLLPGAAGGANP